MIQVSFLGLYECLIIVSFWLGVGTKIDPTLCRADRMVGQVLFEFSNSLLIFFVCSFEGLCLVPGVTNCYNGGLTKQTSEPTIITLIFQVSSRSQASYRVIEQEMFFWLRVHHYRFPVAHLLCMNLSDALKRVKQQPNPNTSKRNKEKISQLLTSRGTRSFRFR